MIIILRPGAPEEDIERVVRKIEVSGAEAHIDRGVERVIVGVRSGRHDLQPEMFRLLPSVSDVVRILKPYKLCSREFHPGDTVFSVKGHAVGGPGIAVVAGPCSVEGEEQIVSTALAVRDAGASFLRGGAYKPRSSPYAFQGMGVEGLQLLRKASDASGLPVVTEVMQIAQIEDVAAYADVMQIGARNMQNYDLLKEVAGAGKPVVLKRGLAAKIEDLLLSAEYLLAGGCEEVILCERGIRTFETTTRNTLDIAAVPVLKSLSHLPVVIDPSHAAGEVAYVRSLALAAVAAGADGLMIEVHPQPECAMSDGQQSFDFAGFAETMTACRRVAEAVGRHI